MSNVSLYDFMFFSTACCLDILISTKRNKDLFVNYSYQTRYENLLLQSWWLLKEPVVVLSEGKVFKLLNLRIRTGCVPAS